MTGLDPHLFRHASGRVVALLSRRAGLRHLAAIEDATQFALVTALETWPTSGQPDDPVAWVLRVASRELFSRLRQTARREELAQLEHDAHALQAAPDAFLHGDVRDEVLRLLFACCDAAIPLEAQLALALKTLCGFDVREIAERPSPARPTSTNASRAGARG